VIVAYTAIRQTGTDQEFGKGVYEKKQSYHSIKQGKDHQEESRELETQERLEIPVAPRGHPRPDRYPKAVQESAHKCLLQQAALSEIRIA
jgi:hypothetical protein